MNKNLSLYTVAACLLLVATLLAGPSALFAASSDSAAATEITIDNFSFTPPTITVKAGTLITWKNRDDIPHTVVSSDNLFKSKALDTDDKFTFTPTKPGTYAYFCSLHPKMTGKLVVE